MLSPANKLVIACFCLLNTITITAQAKLGNTVTQNNLLYGEPNKIAPFPSKRGFSGNIIYPIDANWKIKVFYAEDKAIIEHLLPQNSHSKFTKDEAKAWTLKMFGEADRGPYKTQLNFPRVEGHFFDSGLIAYEYFLSGKKPNGYKAVKVLFYNDGDKFSKVNPKAYL